MKKETILAFIGLYLIFTQTQANTCDYSQISGNEYQLADLSKKFVTIKFFIDPNKDRFSSIQRNEKKYSSLKENKFKVMETGVPTKYHERFSTASNDRFSDIVINNKAYVLDKFLSTKLITSNCEVFFLNIESPMSVETIGNSFLKADNSPANTSSYIEIIGKALQPKDTSATVSFDRFEKIVNIQTKDFNSMLIRGRYNPTTKKTDSIQLYLNTSFIGNWGNIKIAYDLNGKTHEVVNINSDADCSNRYMGCELQETLGVSLSEEFLRKNSTGFELKLVGKQEKIIKVTGDLVNAFLDGLNKAKNEY